MKQKTALQKFLEQIVLRKVDGSVYLMPSITDIQIKELLELEKKQIIDAFCNGDNSDCLAEQDPKEFAEQYFTQAFEQ